MKTKIIMSNAVIDTGSAYARSKIIAAEYGICKRTVARWADQGFIHRHKVNSRVVLFNRAEVAGFVKSVRIN